MRHLLLDTHVLLWWLGEDWRIRREAYHLIGSRECRIIVSAATIWEASIKAQLGKLGVPPRLHEIVHEKEFELLPMSPVHAETAGFLPLHHRDPFDRMLIAQGRIEQLEIVTADPVFARYGAMVVAAV